MTPEIPAPTPSMFEVSQDVPRIYANFALLQPGALDVTILLGHQVAAESPRWSVQATMSWEEARLLVGLLTGAIEAHERTFGAVRDVAKIAKETMEKAQATAEGQTGGEPQSA